MKKKLLLAGSIFVLGLVLLLAGCSPRQKGEIHKVTRVSTKELIEYKATLVNSLTNEKQNKITQDLLFIDDVNDSRIAITWGSSNEDVISRTGKVTRFAVDKKVKVSFTIQDKNFESNFDGFVREYTVKGAASMVTYGKNIESNVLNGSTHPDVVDVKFVLTAPEGYILGDITVNGKLYITLSGNEYYEFTMNTLSSIHVEVALIKKYNVNYNTEYLTLIQGEKDFYVEGDILAFSVKNSKVSRVLRNGNQINVVGGVFQITITEDTNLTVLFRA